MGGTFYTHHQCARQTCVLTIKSVPYSPSNDELIVAVNPASGAAQGSVSKVQAHQDGTWHATIHCWILDQDRRLIFQSRSLTKATFPGLWDVSAAGHLRPGEDGLREVEEELGAIVTLEELTSVGVLTVDQHYGELFNRERPRVYLWDSGRALDSFSFTDGEVTALLSINIVSLVKLLQGEVVPALAYDTKGLYETSLNINNVVPLSNEYWNTLLESLYKAVPDSQVGPAPAPAH